MTELIESFETTAGTSVRKVRDKNGRIMRFADGTPVSAKAYGGYARHKTTPDFPTDDRPTSDDAAIRDAESRGFRFTSGGTNVMVPVPKYDENGNYDGYEQIEVDADGSGSRYGRSVALTQDGAKERPPDTTVVGGERYETADLARAADDAADAGLDIMDYRN